MIWCFMSDLADHILNRGFWGPNFVLIVKTKSIFRERNIICLEIITCNLSIFTMDHSDLTLSNFMKKSIGLKRFKRYVTDSRTLRIH